MHPASTRKSEVIGRLAGKVSKQDVNYRSAPENQKENCMECSFYTQKKQPTSECVRVAGMVAAEDLCDLFKSRNDEAGQESKDIKISISVGD